MNILGISAFYHDSAAALVREGRVLAAAQEERFTRKKHDAGFPSHAVAYCLEAGGLREEEVDLVVFYEKPLLRFERLLETYIAYAPMGFRQFLISIPVWLRRKLHLPREIDRALGGRRRGRYVFCEHHESHAASAFYPSPFDQAAILTLDGVGEWATATTGTGRGHRITLLQALHFPHSLGLLYSAFTYYTGFKVNSGEYKLMGLAPYGRPRYADLIRRELIDLKEDGSFRLNMDYLPYGYKTVMINRRFERLFGGPARAPEGPLTERDMDVAASIQLVTEEVMLRAARHLHRQTGMKDLVLAGGVALNCVGNGRVLREGPFERVWIQPAAGDAGGAIGAALFTWHQLLGQERVADPLDSQAGSLLGPAFSTDQIQDFLNRAGASYQRLAEEGELLDRVADLIAQEKVIGWFQGRMEFGPRALGSRSILGDARSHTMQSRMNLKIKFRESFRPFAPCVLQERAHDYFEMEPGQESPYMLLVAPVRRDKRIDPTGPLAKGLDRLKTPRSVIPAVTHVDDSARVQTVDARRHPRLYGLIRRFQSKTGCPVLINTSFNIRGEPIVCTPEQAYRCFMATDMDVLVMEDLVLYKEAQPQAAGPDVAAYKAQVRMD
ncbi:MAG: carbamoyltransferase [Phycisphaerae bacterium]|nr:carbamoyltransferase [Phycisphaerae bacterium]